MRKLLEKFVRDEKGVAALELGILLLLLAGIVLWPQAAGVDGQDAAAPDKVVQLRPVGVVPGQYIVVFQDNVDNPRGLANALARDNGFALRGTYSFAIKGFAARMPATVAKRLALDPDVAYVEPDVYAHAFLHGNNFQTMPTGVERIGAHLNATANIDGVDERVDVDIAIIDTGIDLDNPDLNVFRAVDCTKGPNCERGGDGDDGNGHGTHVAGAAAALDNGIGVVGVAPGARIWGVKVLRNDGSGFFSDIIEGIDYVTAHADEIEVANMSLGGTGSLNSLRTALQNSVATGVVHVVSAGNASPGYAPRDVYGNDGVFPSGDDIIPAAYPEVATISALGDSDGQVGGLGPDTSDGLDDTLASFSNYSNSVVGGNPVISSGAAIDLAGPGVDITSTWIDGLYGTISGTSMASPHVAGAAALEIATNGRANDAQGVADIRQALIDAAEAQAYWGPADTNDPDANPEGLVYVAGGPPPPPNDAPTVNITSPASDSTFDWDATIIFTGTASDTEDGDLTGSLAWISSIDGAIGAGGGFSTTLSTGTHTITASVTDSGSEPGSDSISVTVDPPPGGSTVSVESITYAIFGGKAGDKHLSITVSLDDDPTGSGNPVAGASVTVQITGPKSGGGTEITDGLGQVTFSVKNAPNGCTYTTTVTNVTASGYTWDPGAGDPANTDTMCK